MIIIPSHFPPALPQHRLPYVDQTKGLRKSYILHFKQNHSSLKKKKKKKTPINIPLSIPPSASWNGVGNVFKKSIQIIAKLDSESPMNNSMKRRGRERLHEGERH